MAWIFWNILVVAFMSGKFFEPLNVASRFDVGVVGVGISNP